MLFGDIYVFWDVHNRIDIIHYLYDVGKVQVEINQIFIFYESLWSYIRFWFLLIRNFSIRKIAGTSLAKLDLRPHYLSLRIIHPNSRSDT